jgi:hypothetical protein
MSSTGTQPLASWASRARETFFASWAFVPVNAILNQLGVVNSRSGPWLVVSIALAVVWTVSGLTWGFGEYSRRQR